MEDGTGSSSLKFISGAREDLASIKPEMRNANRGYPPHLAPPPPPIKSGRLESRLHEQLTELGKVVVRTLLEG